MHPIVTRIRTLLEEHAIPYTFMEHEEGITSEDMVRIRKEFSLAEGTKALILSTEKGYVQMVVPGDRRFSNSKARKALGVKTIRFATPEELKEITDNILPGAVPPFGSLFSLPVYVDTAVFENKRIVFNCGERSMSIAMQATDYKELLQPTVVPLT